MKVLFNNRNHIHIHTHMTFSPCRLPGLRSGAEALASPPCSLEVNYVHFTSRDSLSICLKSSQTTTSPSMAAVIANN